MRGGWFMVFVSAWPVPTVPSHLWCQFMPYADMWRRDGCLDGKVPFKCATGVTGGWRVLPAVASVWWMSPLIGREFDIQHITVARAVQHPIETILADETASPLLISQRF